MKRRAVFALPLSLWGQRTDGLAHTLKTYVTTNGRVRYAALKDDLEPLTRYVEELKTFDADRLPSREARLAHWLNAYNALILWSVAAEYPQEKDRLKNPLRRASYFYQRKFLVGGRERSLANIEDESLRKAFSEPRIHFAIVFGSASCPWLSHEVYTAKNVMARIEADAQRFVTSARNVKVDAAAKTVTVSELFKWFRKDFGGSDAKVLAFLARYQAKARLSEPGWKLKFEPYDWSINDQP